jgi:hypothetical protein
LDAFGRRQAGEEAPSVLRSALFATIIAVQQLIADPHRVEADLLGGTGHGEVLRPRHVTLDLRKLHTHTKASGHPRRLGTIDR